jgi:cell division protease FtsH
MTTHKIDINHEDRQAKTFSDDLDRSIDAGLDRFGHFLRRHWLLLALLILIIWFFLSGTTLLGLDPGTLLGYVAEVLFVIFAAVIQFVAIFWFLGRPRLYWVMPGETGVTFADYKGNPEVLESARRIVSLLRGLGQFRAMGGNPVRGLLLSGPPGTGKSYLAQCMSSEAGVPFAYASAASFRAMFIGMDVLMIRNLYTKARRLAREYGACVIFMDEIDAIATSRGGRSNTMNGGGMMGMFGGSGGLNQLLMEMDPPDIETGWFKKLLRVVGLYHGRVQNEPVLTVGATNLPDALDSALLRPGRFDRRIHVAPPTDRYRPEVIRYYLQKVAYDQSISVTTISARLVDYTPVAIKHIINEAVIIAHFAGREQVRYQDLIEAQDVHEYGLRQQSELTPLDRRRLAYHEAGHTVATYYLLERYFPSYVTIHMRSDMQSAAAFAHPRPKEAIKTVSKEEILANIQISLAARASEELFLHVQLAGASADLATATEEATRYIATYAMDGTLTSFNALQSALGQNDSPSISHLQERVEHLLQTQLHEVKTLLSTHTNALIAVAEALIARDELFADDIQKLIDDADAQQPAS